MANEDSSQDGPVDSDGGSGERPPSHAPAQGLQDQPLNASLLAQAAMGQRGKDRRNGKKTDADSAEEGVVALTGGSENDDSQQGKKTKKRGSFWRSRGMVLFAVFMALLLDETLMTVIVPIIPDYLLNNCVRERCLELNLSSTECDSLRTPQAADDIGATASYTHQTDPLHALDAGVRTDHVTTAPPTVDGSLPESSGTSGLEDDFFATTPGPATTNRFDDDVTSVPDGWIGASSDVPGFTAAPSVEDECTEAINPKTGILFASKFFVRIALSPFIGTFAHKIGFSLMLLSGCAIMTVSSFVFAFGVSYEALLTARIVHGLGATLNEIGGLGLVAYTYRNDEKRRGFALGLAIGGFAAGTLIGPAVGGIFYDFLGKESPFLIMAGFLIALGVLELAVLNPRKKQRQLVTEGSPVYKLILDPYVLVTAGALMIASGVVALLEPTLPIWMRHNIHPPPDTWQLGAVFLPSGLSYVVSSTITGYLGYKIGRWSLAMFALVALAASVSATPYTSTFLQLVGPMVGTGFGFGTVDSTMTAMLNSRVDARHKGAYGGAAAISTLAFCLGFAIGPSISGFLTNAFGFKWLMRGIAVITVLYAPLCIALRRPGNANQSAGDNNNEYASGARSDGTGDAEGQRPPSITRRLSRV